MAAAIIHDAVAIALLTRAASPSTERQRQFAVVLGINVDKDSLRVASARIGHALCLKNVETISRLKLKPGVFVIKETEVEVDGRKETLRDYGVISSIKDGIVYFRGGNGRCAPASRLRLPTRREAQLIRNGEWLF